MKRNMLILLISLTLFTIAVVIGIFILQREPEEKEFSGYILWLREAVVFSYKVDFNKNSVFEMIGPIVWVEQNAVVYSLYDSAYTITKGTSPYDDDDIKIIKVTFRGLYYNKNFLYWKSGLHEAKSKVEVVKVIDYSDKID